VKKLLAFAALIMAVIIWAPLAVAVVVVSVVAPGAVSTIDCDANVPGAATRDWRPPFQQRYALTSPFGRRFHPIYKECPYIRSGGCTPAKTSPRYPALGRSLPPRRNRDQR
jgi:hypothetical protein